MASQVRNVDIAPTLLDLAGVPTPEPFEGTSLLPLMTSEAAAEDRPSYAALGVPLFPDASVQTAVTTGAWTYARNAPPIEEEPEAYASRALAPGEELLFDRGVVYKDGLGRYALILTILGIAGALSDLGLNIYLTPLADVKEEGVRIDPAIADRLRAMGYLR